MNVNVSHLTAPLPETARDYLGQQQPIPWPKGDLVARLGAVYMIRTSDLRFAVVYGLSVKERLELWNAWKEFGECVEHQVRCGDMPIWSGQPAKAVGAPYRLDVNLDDPEEAEMFTNRHRQDKGPVLARRLGFKGEGSAQAADALLNYAWNKVTAVSCRGRGDVTNALAYEEICDRIYREDIVGKIECW